LSGTTTTPTQLIIDGCLRVSGNVDLYKGGKIVVMPNAQLIICGGTYINEYSRIFCKKRIFIGAGCAIAWNVCIMDTDMHKIYDGENVINPNADVYVGNNVWIGANTFIGKGTNIKDNCILGACTVASTEIASGFIHTGIPSHPVKQFTKWL
jgi:acetyltransferase-like isoleucine patch superfamily enzyme